MRITVTFEVSDKTARIVSQNSIERVINESCKLLERSMPSHIGLWPRSAEDWKGNVMDWDECQDVVVNMWNGLRDGVFRTKDREVPIAQVSDWIV